MGKAGNIALGAGVVVGGALAYGAYHDAECIGETLGLGEGGPKLLACAPSFEFGQPEPHADAHLGGLEVQAEELTGTAMVMAFGEVTMQIGGDQSKLDYEDDALLDLPETDATYYWNRGGDGAADVVYNPCITIGDNYAEQVEHPREVTDEAGAVLQSEQGEPQEAGVNWEVEVDEQGRPTGVTTTNDVVLDTCFMRLPNTPNNQLLFGGRAANQTDQFNHQRSTFEWMVTRRITDYALASACPEAVLDLEAVESQLSEVVLGDVIAANPGMAAVFTELHESGEFDIDLAPPEVRREHYIAELEATNEELAEMDRSFPNEDDDDETYPMDVTLGDLTVESCSTAEEVTVRGTGD